MQEFKNVFICLNIRIQKENKAWINKHLNQKMYLNMVPADSHLWFLCHQICHHWNYLHILWRMCIFFHCIYTWKSVTEACFYFCKSILFLQVLFIFAPFLLVMCLVSQISEPAHPAPTSVSLQVTRPWPKFTQLLIRYLHWFTVEQLHLIW